MTMYSVIKSLNFLNNLIFFACCWFIDDIVACLLRTGSVKKKKKNSVVTVKETATIFKENMSKFLQRKGQEMVLHSVQRKKVLHTLPEGSC